MSGGIPDDAPRWAGYTHEELYELVHTGPGPAASQYAEGRWYGARFAIELVEARLSKAIADAGSGWEGQAAAATTAGVSPLGAWALSSADEALRTTRALESQAADADHVRRSMPAPETSPGDGYGVTPGFLADWSAADRRRDQQAQRAVDLMAQYTERSMDNFVNLGRWTAPPEVVFTQPATPGASTGGAPGATSWAAPADISPAADTAAAAAATATGPPAGVTAPGITPTGVTPGAVPPPATLPGTSLGPATGAGSSPGGGEGGFRPIVPGPPRMDPAAAVPLGPFASGTGMGVPPGTASRPGLTADVGGRGSPWPGGPAGTVGEAAGRNGLRAGGGARVVADPLPPLARGSTGSPEQPFPSVGGNGEPTSRGGGARPGHLGGPGFMPMGMGAGAHDRGHRRPDYLIDADVFADDRRFTPPVIGADDVEVPRG